MVVCDWERERMMEGDGRLGVVLILHQPKMSDLLFSLSLALALTLAVGVTNFCSLPEDLHVGGMISRMVTH